MPPSRATPHDSGQLWATIPSTYDYFICTHPPASRRTAKIFGTAKRSYGLRRARYHGMPRLSGQVHLTFVPYNLRRAAALLRAESV